MFAPPTLRRVSALMVKVLRTLLKMMPFPHGTWVWLQVGRGGGGREGRSTLLVEAALMWESRLFTVCAEDSVKGGHSVAEHLPCAWPCSHAGCLRGSHRSPSPCPSISQLEAGGVDTCQRDV